MMNLLIFWRNTNLIKSKMIVNGMIERLYDTNEGVAGELRFLL